MSSRLWKLIEVIVKHCAVAFERSDAGWRVSARGPLGVAALLVLVILLSQFASDFVYLLNLDIAALPTE